MLIVKVNRKLFTSLTLAIVLIFSLIFNIYSYFHNTELSDKYESLICISNQFGKVGVLPFIASADIDAYRNGVVEIFDVSKGEVIKKIPLSDEIQKAATGYLDRISSVYGKFKPFPDDGYIVKIPLTPSVKVQSNLLNDYNIYFVKEVFILFPKQSKPYLLILDPKSRPLFYNFEGDAKSLLKKLMIESIL